MKNILLFFLFICCFTCNAQISLDFPILTEKPIRGVYNSLKEFQLNSPGIRDSFFIEAKPRTTANWKGTFEPIPKYVPSGKKVKKVWGFSDGNKTYIYHQFEFFEIRIEKEVISFDGYGIPDQSGVAVAGVLGGAIGGGIYAAAVVSKAKNQRFTYILDLMSGEIAPEGSSFSENEIDRPTIGKIIVYRRGKKEKDDPLVFTVNDGPKKELIPNSLMELELPISAKPVKVCYGDEECLELLILNDEPKYLQGEMLLKGGVPKMIEVKENVGEFYLKEVKYFQDKRESR